MKNYSTSQKLFRSLGSLFSEAQPLSLHSSTTYSTLPNFIKSPVSKAYPFIYQSNIQSKIFT